MFKEFWDKQRKLSPEEPEMISLCKILHGSGEDRRMIEIIFDTYIPKDSFTKIERKEMINYLVDLAEDIY